MGGPRLTTVTISVDTGGTFTDAVLRWQSVQVTHKVPSTPSDPSIAVSTSIRELLRRAGLPEDTKCEVIHGSTVATNTLLEGTGATAILLTTAGFEDVLRIGRQNRPALYAMAPRRAQAPIPPARCLGVDERVDHTGQVRRPFLESCLDRFDENLSRADAVAISLLHSYANPAHERAIAKTLRRRHPHLHLTLSSELNPEFREYERAATCAANAVVGPRMAAYVKRLEDSSVGASLRIMSSSGGIMTGQQCRAQPVHTVLSGPAGGVLGALDIGRSVGTPRIITFDMGGTSTDVSLCDGRLTMTSAISIAGLPIRISAIDIHTVGAGGGSIAWIDDGGALRVGPHSAGADPGPACYGRGGADPTVTDANIVLGRIDPLSFLGGDMALVPERAHEVIAALAEDLSLTSHATALGIVRVAEATMARALKVISVERGHDPRDFSLLSFGGAGGLHACSLAAQLGVPRVVVPPSPGLLSAVGMWGAPAISTASEAVLKVVDGDATLQPSPDIRTRVLEDLDLQGFSPDQCTVHATACLRYTGQSHEIDVPADEGIEGFHTAHERLYGYRCALPVELVARRIRAEAARSGCQPSRSAPGTITAPEGTISRDELALGARGEGPLLVTEYSSTTWIPRGWRLEVHVSGCLILHHQEGAA
jgi:N-methylhydantoinase A